MNAHRPRILIVDDEPAFCRATARALSANGYAADVVSDPRAAVGQLVVNLRLRIPYEIVLLDVVMERSGLDVLRDLRAADPDVEVIMVSAHRDSSYAREARSRGAGDLLYKPIGTSALVRAIEAARERWEGALFGARQEITDVTELLRRSNAYVAARRLREDHGIARPG